MDSPLASPAAPTPLDIVQLPAAIPSPAAGADAAPHARFRRLVVFTGRLA